MGAGTHTKKNWTKVIFSDETTFWLGRSGVARWKPLEEKNIHMVSKNIPKIHMGSHELEWKSFNYDFSRKSDKPFLC